MARRGKTTTYGERGGTGPTAGRKKTNYMAIGPDGKQYRAGSFFVTPDDKPSIAFYFSSRDRSWHTSGVWSAVEADKWMREIEPGTITLVPAIKVEKP